MYVVYVKNPLNSAPFLLYGIKAEFPFRSHCEVLHLLFYLPNTISSLLVLLLHLPLQLLPSPWNALS